MKKRALRSYLSVLIGRKNLLRLSGATAGALLGFFILMAALQLMFDARHFMQHDEDDLFAPGIVVVNKKVSLLTTLGLSGNAFTPDEIADLREQPFVNRAEPFVPCQFRVSVTIDLSGFQIPDFFSEFFFESVPDDLVDIPKNQWSWQPGDQVLPVVLPADFLKFYNFGFAPGQGLPQLSEKSLRLANLKVTIEGRDQHFVVNGKIVGLSERINTILVPEAFMRYANNRFGDNAAYHPTRLVVVSKVAADPNLSAFIRERNYETNQSELRSGKLNQLLQMSLVVTGLIGLIIILLALYLFVLSFSLFIVRSDYEIRTLMQLGVPPASLVRYLFKMLLVLVSVILLFNSVLIGVLHGLVQRSLYDKGIVVMEGTSVYTYLIAFILIGVVLVINHLNIRKNILRLTR